MIIPVWYSLDRSFVLYLWCGERWLLVRLKAFSETHSQRLGCGHMWGWLSLEMGKLFFSRASHVLSVSLESGWSLMVDGYIDWTSSLGIYI